MSTETVIVPAGHFYCAIPAALVEGEPVVCSGVMFRKVDEESCELVFLTEADVERLTEPGA
jgi:hypothetical protein